MLENFLRKIHTRIYKTRVKSFETHVAYDLHMQKNNPEYTEEILRVHTQRARQKAEKAGQKLGLTPEQVDADLFEARRKAHLPKRGRR